MSAGATHRRRRCLPLRSGSHPQSAAKGPSVQLDFDLPAELIAQAPVYSARSAKAFTFLAKGRRDGLGSIASVLWPGIYYFNCSRTRARLFWCATSRS